MSSNLTARSDYSRTNVKGEKMQILVSTKKTRTTASPGIVYRTVCQNRGCGFKFDLKITPENTRLLSGSTTCPHCRRHGGQLKSQGRISEKFFAAKLLFRPTGVGLARSDDDEKEVD
jgi:hypothetical protein